MMKTDGIMKNIFKTTFVIIALLQSIFSINAQEFLSVVPTSGSLLNAIPSDIYIKPRGGIANEFQPGTTEGPIALSFDGNMNTWYHSPFSGATVFPVILSYLFADTVSQIDYAVYYPRPTGTNGFFINVEVWYAANGGPMTKYNDYNFGGTNSPFQVNFDPAIIKPDTIRFVVKSGTGDSEGTYASCAEMQFYRKAAGTFDYTTIFTDASCSELKPGVTIDDINGISTEFYRKLASDIYYGFYDPEFRVQEYKAYQTPDYMQGINKTARYGISDGVTGIYASSNSDVVLLMETTSDAIMPSLFVHDATTAAGGSSYPLHRGINKIRVSNGGLMYIRYYTPTGTEPPAKINIVNGIVNGYYDKARHTPADWQRLLDNATFPLFQMKGDYTVLCFETSVFRTSAKTNGPALLDLYDKLAYEEMNFEGMVKYNKMFNTRMCLFVDPSPTAPLAYATDYYTGFSKGTQTSYLSVASLTDPNNTGGPAWGPAHEVGHVNQTRPGFRWLGMTEVSNNVLSQYITILFGNRSRLQTEDMGGGKNRYTVAITGIVKSPAIVNYLQHSDVFCRLIPFWQLKLYIVDALGETDFYKDLYEKIRVNPNPVAQYGCSTDAMCMLEFVRLVCEISGYDMTDFFTDWKFLNPVNIVIDDYSSGNFIITQQGLDALKAKIAAMGLPKPPVPEGLNLYDINDSNWQDYKVP